MGEWDVIWCTHRKDSQRGNKERGEMRGSDKDRKAH